MTRTRFLLAGLIAGAMVAGTACKSDKAAERGDTPEQIQPIPHTPAENQGGTTPDSTAPGDTGGAGSDIDRGPENPNNDLNPSPERAPDTGGSGLQNPEGPGTGGSGDVGQGDLGGTGTQNPENQGTGTGSGTTIQGSPDTNSSPDMSTPLVPYEEGQKPKKKTRGNTTGRGGAGLDANERFGGDSFPTDNKTDPDDN
ncbi:hypothetical protein [Vitiosangium sp. GDMCC 1.1324]|uniref:hypothetical protein n=1 Tax=Vitiosangium sp. (strain GDMCC 1.1324) TaxID=2138576 RepID=UPI000D3B65C4|nr:hypothetical protein [Vitiosangium sp. GDMCC 1.1324]PTL79690.1 hypothetical protein DAT35_33350 [Vitiosangium sp. GDMCC 1.1324]